MFVQLRENLDFRSGSGTLQLADIVEWLSEPCCRSVPMRGILFVAVPLKGLLNYLNRALCAMQQISAAGT